MGFSVSTRVEWRCWLGVVLLPFAHSFGVIQDFFGFDDFTASKELLPTDAVCVPGKETIASQLIGIVAADCGLDSL